MEKRKGRLWWKGHGNCCGKPVLALVLAGMMAVPFTVNAALEEQTAKVWISDWRHQVFQNDKGPEDALEPVGKAVTLVTGRNDTEPFCVNVRPKTDGTIICVAFSNLVCGENVILAEHISYSYVDYIQAANNSRYTDDTDPDAVKDGDGIWWVNISDPVRKTSPDIPVGFPEILTKKQSRVVKKDKTQPIWIKIHVPASAAPGMYLGQMEVRTSFGTYPFDINLDVKNVIIPGTASPEAFSIELWSQLVGNFDTEVDVITDAYGVEVDSPEWWAVMESFAQVMRENRLNVMTVNQTDLLLQGKGTKVNPDGSVVFDWSFFNKFVAFFREKAGIQRFACGPVAKFKTNPRNYGNDIPGEEINDYTMPFVEVLSYDPVNPSVPKKELLEVDLEAYEAGVSGPALYYLSQYAGSLNQNLMRQGWKDLWYHHIIDEPGKRTQAALYPVVEGVLSRGCPGMPTGDAFTAWTAEEESAYSEVYSIMEYSLDELPDKVAGFLNPGDRLQVYTSSLPLKDHYLNRMIDHPTWHAEMLGWFCYKHGATGYLHWGMNQWNTWTKDYQPFPDYPREMMWDNALGDGSCVYPDKESLSIRSSIRVEALREMSELVSVIWAAEKKYPEEVRNLLDSLLRSGKDYETDIGQIRQAREKLFNLAAD